MKPPETMNVLDRHGGFTAMVPTKDPYTGRMTGSPNTLWRPGAVLKSGVVGRLVGYSEHGFYQTNENATVARYAVPGYRYPVAVWFDNATGERIA